MSSVDSSLATERQRTKLCSALSPYKLNDQPTLSYTLKQSQLVDGIRAGGAPAAEAGAGPPITGRIGIIGAPIGGPGIGAIGRIPATSSRHDDASVKQKAKC